MIARFNIFGILVGLLLSAQSVFCDPDDSLEIRSISVNGRSLAWRGKGEASLGSSPEEIAFAFGPKTNSAPLRIRYNLEGYENEWHDGPGEMLLMIRFYNSAGDQISVNNFKISGESPGWNRSLATSPLTHRRETVVVPEQASRLWVIISSAGPPATVGIYVVANLMVSKSSTNSGPVVLLESPFDHQPNEDTNRIPAGWMRDGTHPSMATIVTVGQNPPQKAFAIVDDDSGSHAEWHNLKESAPAVTPGDHI